MPTSSTPDHDEHVRTLRLALHSIIAPKRPYYPRSSSTSGTASPTPTPLSGVHTDHPTTPHLATAHLQAHHALFPYSHSDTPPLPPADVRGALSMPDAGVAVPMPAHAPPHARPDFLGTLQSKSAWDALIHGSWV